MPFSPTRVAHVPVGTQLQVISLSYGVDGGLTIYLICFLPGVAPGLVLVVRLVHSYWAG